ncbi:unnamed protein product [Heligmosomoides polygyrus]|uniref:Portal protein n=1 Tax=Heligmosomoides polygyrus TaxID=6339 RepID=A0A183GV65_HELPZ|nr:unnamed protein product [Heligmosomoides polygyrus]
MMRSNEFSVGIPVEDENGEVLGSSLKVPYTAIPQVVVSRIGMAVPSMTVDGVTRSNTNVRFLLDVLDTLVLCSLPSENAYSDLIQMRNLYYITNTMTVKRLEPEVQKKIYALPNPPEIVYYNKGL